MKPDEQQQQRRRRESNPAILLQNARYIKMSVLDKQKPPIASKPGNKEMGLTCQGFLLVPNSKTPPIVKSKQKQLRGKAEKGESKGNEAIKCYESLPTFLVMPPPPMSPTSSDMEQEPHYKTQSKSITVSPRLKKFLSRFSSKK